MNSVTTNTSDGWRMAEKSVDGSWRGPELTGGCPKHPTWPANPQFTLAPSTAGDCIVELSQKQAPDARAIDAR